MGPFQFIIVTQLDPIRL